MQTAAFYFSHLKKTTTKQVIVALVTSSRLRFTFQLLQTQFRIPPSSVAASREPKRRVDALSASESLLPPPLQSIPPAKTTVKTLSEISPGVSTCEGGCQGAAERIQHCHRRLTRGELRLLFRISFGSLLSIKCSAGGGRGGWGHKVSAPVSLFTS